VSIVNYSRLERLDASYLQWFGIINVLQVAIFKAMTLPLFLSRIDFLIKQEGEAESHNGE
jgi:hypothetical protein